MTRRQPLPDIGRPGCRVLFVGINPGLRSHELGHHYAGHGNRFWKLLHQSGLIPEPLTFEEDHRLPEFGLASTNIVDRPSRSAGELTPDDFRRGRKILRAKILRLRPIVTAFVGVVVYREFFELKNTPVACGLTSDKIGISKVFVLPNPSGRNAHYSYARMLEIYGALATHSSS